MGVRIADTSFLITLFDDDDDRQGSAWREAEEPDPIVVPPTVVGETLGVIHAREGFELARGIWEELQEIPHLQFLEESLQEPTAELFLNHGGALSWVDAAVVAWCDKHHVEPLEFDTGIREACDRSSSP